MNKTLKQSLSWLLVLATLFSLCAAMSVGVAAAEISLGKAGNYITAYYDRDTKTLSLKGYGSMADYVDDGETAIYTKIKSRPWDAYKTEIKAVKMDEGITTIGNAAFFNLIQLSSCNIPSTVQTIGEWAFGSTGLTSVTIPAGTRLVKHFAFNDSKLKSDSTIPNSVCYGATTIENEIITDYYNGIPTGFKGSNAELVDDLNRALSPSVVINASGFVSTGIQWTYSTATKTLQLSYVGEGIATMKDMTSPQTYPWYTYMTEIQSVVVGDHIGNIGAFAFTGAVNLRSVTLGGDVARIGSKAFAGCTALSNLQLPAATLTVATDAFSSRTSKLTVTTPNTKATMDPGNVWADITNPDVVNVVWNYGATTGTPSVPSADQSGAVSGNITWSYSNGRLTLTATQAGAAIPNYDDYSKTPWAQKNLTYSISSVVIGPNITSIGRHAFAFLPSLSSVTIGANVSTIDQYAFAYNTNLRAIAFPASVTKVEPYAFFLCSNLTYASQSNPNMQVMTPNTELYAALNPSGTPSTPGTSGSTVTGQIAGTNLTWSYDMTTKALNITGSGAIPNYTTTVKAPWHTYASLIKAITVQTGVTAIGDYAFANITQVVDLYLPDSVGTIGKEAFAGCTALESIRMPVGLYSLGSGAFRSCSSLEAIELPAAISAIDDYTFRDCVSLNRVKLPDSLLSIGAEAFYGCTGLTSINLPALLSSVGTRAFYGCTGLKSVVFHSSNLTVGVDAFGSCTAIQKAVYMTRIPVVLAGNELLTAKYVSRYSSGQGWIADRAEGTLTLSGTGEVTSSAAWANELPYVDTLIFSDGITGIGEKLLLGNRNVTHVEMADTVTNIGAGAFENCANLQSVSLSNGLITLGARAFYGCSALTSVVLPDSLKIVPEHAFAYCPSLASVTMGQNVMMIGASAFTNCRALNSLVLPASLRVISAGAFNDCAALATLELRSNNMNALVKETFDNCSSLSTVRFHGTSAQWATMVANADNEIARATVIYCVKLTVNHVYKGGPLDGQLVSQPDVFSAVKGGTLDVVPKNCDPHYEAGEYTAKVTMGSENQEITITYAPKTYTLTIQFKDAETGKKLGADKTVSVKYGDSFEATAGTLEGYTVVDGRIYVESMPGDYTYEVKFNKNVYTYTVEYVNTKTNKVISTKEGQAKHGESVVAETPEMTGYTLVEGTYKIDKLTKDGQKITVKYDPAQKSLTIEYVDTQGNKIANPVTKSVYYGEEVKIDSPVITGKVADKETVTLESYNGEEKITVTYDWRYYTVTVRFIEKDSYSYQVRPDYVKSVKHGDAFTFVMDESYNEAAYVTDKSSVTYASVTADITETITYSPKPLKLTIEYKNADGKLLGTAEQTVYAGQSYTVEEHTVKNYLQTEEPVSGTMGVEDKTITIELEKDPSAGKVGRVFLVIAIILVVLGTGGALFYFLYLKKKPY